MRPLCKGVPVTTIETDLKHEGIETLLCLNFNGSAYPQIGKDLNKEGIETYQEVGCILSYKFKSEKT